MMDNAEVIKAIRHIRLKLNFNKELKHLYRHLFEDIGLLSVSAYALFSGSGILYLLSQAGFSIFFFRSFGMMHECVHKNVSSKEVVNSIIGLIYGSICFLPFHNWRAIHLQHHLWAGNIDRDPTMKLVKSIPLMSKDKVNKLNAFWKLWLPYLALLQHVVFWKESLRLYKEKPGNIGLLFSMVGPFLMLLGISVISLQSPYLGLLPSVFTYLVMVEVVNFPHHLGMPYLRGNKRISYLEQYKVSRSCHYHPVLSRFIFMNFNYHTEHHLYPNLPWHQLPSLVQHTQQTLDSNKYNYDEGHSWIIRARAQDIKDVLKSANSESDRAA